tara:strand:+ start:171 stop:1196 length:1026 start_codon:yes stop_codon:yes gene_type:complete
LLKYLEHNMKNKILITGSEGFIGSHLTERLVRDGYNVKALVLYNSFNNHGWLEDIPKEIKNNVEIVLGDIRDTHGIDEIVRDCNKIMHLAALIAIPYSYQSPFSYIETNIVGTLNLLQAARKFKIEKFVHTSTSEVYGTAKYVPINEDHPQEGQSPYSASKIGADQIVSSFYRSFNAPVTILRPFNTYGPRQSARAIIPTIVAQLAANKKKISLGSLKPTRDFSFIEDTIEGFVKSMDSKKNLGDVFNIGSGYEISMKELVVIISKIMKKETPTTLDIKRIRPKLSEVQRLVCDNKKSKKVLNWKPKYSGKIGLEKGLRKTIEWYKNPENLKKFKSNSYNI